MVHSHPYQVGEDIGPACGVDETVPYDGRASIADVILQTRLATNAMDKGTVSNLNDFTGVVIDKDGIRITEGGLGLASELTGQPITGQEILNNTQTEEPCHVDTND